MFDRETSEVRECGNCGRSSGILRCSRCRSAFFCSAGCQRAHWPFHKHVCRRNEIADAVEDSDAKFAIWLRKHGKQAVLKDDEFDRIERAAAATCGTQSREDVIASMYGRLDPKPEAPSYSLEERRAMQLQTEAEANENRRWTPQQRVWQQIELPSDLGLDCDNYKWRQNQTHVEVFVCLPETARPDQVAVDITAQHLRVTVCGSQVLGGQLLRQVNPYCSAWQVADGIVEVTLLKASRRGHYAPGTTNADTYWDRVWAKALPQDRLPLPQPPLHYYSSSVFDDDGALAGGGGAHAQIGSAAHTVKAAVGATQTPSLQLVATQS